MFSQLRRKKQQKELLSDLMKGMNLLLSDGRKNDLLFDELKKQKTSDHEWSQESAGKTWRLQVEIVGKHALRLLLDVRCANCVRHTLSVDWRNGAYRDVLVSTNLGLVEDKMFEYSFDNFRKEVRKMDTTNVFAFLLTLGQTASGIRFETKQETQAMPECVCGLPNTSGDERKRQQEQEERLEQAEQLAQADAQTASHLLDQTYINYCLDEKRFDLLEQYMNQKNQQ